QEEQLQALSLPAKKKHLEMVRHLPPTEVWSHVDHMPLPNYQPDRAVKAALVAQADWARWKRGGIPHWAYHYPMNPTHTLHVYLGGPRPPSPEEGKAIIAQADLRTILTGRIC